MLLDEQDGQLPVGSDIAQDRQQPVQHHGRQPVAELVDEQQLRIGDECTAEAEHLLFAAGQQACLAARQRPECREVVEYLVGDGGLAAAEAEPQVLGDGELREDPAVLGHQGDAEAGDLVRALPAGRLAEDLDLAAHRGQLAGDGEHRGCLARAVGAEERHQLAGLDVQADPVQRGGVPVSGGQVGDPQRGRGHCPPLAHAPAGPGTGDGVVPGPAAWPR
jgi:hypothetical protein